MHTVRCCMFQICYVVSAESDNWFVVNRADFTKVWSSDAVMIFVLLHVVVRFVSHLAIEF